VNQELGSKVEFIRLIQEFIPDSTKLDGLADNVYFSGQTSYTYYKNSPVSVIDFMGMDSSTESTVLYQ